MPPMPPRMLDLIRMVQTGELPPPPIATLIGFTIRAIEPGHAVMEMEAGPQHANPMGTLHGGVLCDLADAAMGMAYASSLDEGETFTTLELKINFLKPVWTGRPAATGRVVKGGHTVGLVECDVHDDKDRLVARASSTLNDPAGRASRGAVSMSIRAMEWSSAIALVWLFNVVGTLDLINAFYQGLRNNVLLGAAYYIPTFAVPALFVTHAMIFAMLTQRAR